MPCEKTAARRRLLAAFAVAPLSACATRPAAGEAPFNAAELARVLALRPVVLLGEVHDNPVQHRVRAQALARLLESGARPALAFEQFDRERQADLERARAGGGGVEQRTAAMIEAAGRGGWDWSLYRPFVELALRYDLPVVAANLSRAEAMRAGRAGSFEPLFDADHQRRLGLDRLPQEFLQRHQQVIDSAHCYTLPPEAQRRMAYAQIARDVTLLDAIRPHAAGGVVLLTGNGHARNDLGIPFFMSAEERARTLTVGLIEAPAPADQARVAAMRAHFDVAFITPRHERPDPCQALRRRKPAGA